MKDPIELLSIQIELLITGTFFILLAFMSTMFVPLGLLETGKLSKAFLIFMALFGMFECWYGLYLRSTISKARVAEKLMPNGTDAEPN